MRMSRRNTVIIQVYDKRQTGQRSFQEVEESIEDIITRQKTGEQVENLLKELRSNSDIEIMR